MQWNCVLKAWQNHEAELHAYLLHQLHDAYAADDVLQIVYLKAMQQGDGFCTLDNARAWLFQVARNALVDQFRVSKPYLELNEGIPAVPEFQHDPIEELDACIVRNLLELTHDERNIIEQCDLSGVKQQAYATQHGLSLAAVKSRLLRARQHLRSEIAERCQVQYDEFGKVCCHISSHTSD
jgi:RNA polymerase sigma-70 factor (ECF subfamily)